MQVDGASPAGDNREISLYDLILIVRRKWAILVWSTASVTLLALAIALISEPIYRTSVVVAPLSIEAGGPSGLGALGGSLGGLASLAGIGGGEGGAIEQNLAILQSRTLADRFIEKYDMRKDMFPDEWDADAKRWKNPGLVKRLRNFLSSSLPTGGEEDKNADHAGPTAEETFLEFDKRRQVQLNKESGLVTVSFDGQSARKVAEWTSLYLKEANEYIRSREIAEANDRLAYLSEQARIASVVEVRDAISKLMESELKRAMLANVRSEFAFKTIDPAFVPELRVWPKRGLLLAMGMFGGLLMGVFIILIIDYVHRQRPKVNSL